MTEAELLALAAKEARATTVTPDQFLLTVRTKPSYDYKQSHWYKAMRALEQLKKPQQAPASPPPASVDLTPVRNLLVIATASGDIIEGALSLNPRWRVVFSADPVYWPGAAVVNRVKAARGAAWCWCDCRTTLPTAAKLMVAGHGLAGWYGQGENAAEFDVCDTAGGDKAIVNMSALRPDQVAAIASGLMLVTNENYRNVHPAEKPDWRNANNGIGGNCGAVYASSAEGAVYTSVKSQLMNGWFGHWDSWYTEGFTAADWQALREMG